MPSDRPYLLLTGATGLLGRYLLRNLLARDVPVAVVVRATRIASARSRVESLLAEIEQSAGRALPRPRVLCGELSDERLGLCDEDLAWCRRNVGAILHNAASLTFQQGARHEEPWLTNVTGTQNVLAIARRLGVAEFHHVSTAYVCGRRTGRILETELDVGQEFGNDYEASKLEAESLVRSASWLNAPSIYRPAIIVGDSQTAFTNTFHGFYTPLAIAWAMFERAAVDGFQARSLVDILELSGAERKALVPVDWVAAAITHLLLAPQCRGQVYHLTPREATPVALLCEVFDEAVRRRLAARRREAAGPNGSAGLSLAAVGAAFRKQMTVYQAYWRDDPEFDAANTASAAPHLPCPALDRARLLRLCDFAIDNNFWWSRGEEFQPPLDVDAFLSASGALPQAIESGSAAALHVAGAGGGAWRIAGDNQPADHVPAGAKRLANVHLSAQTFQALAARTLDLRTALASGAVAIEGDEISREALTARLGGLFERQPVSPAPTAL